MERGVKNEKSEMSEKRGQLPAPLGPRTTIREPRLIVKVTSDSIEGAATATAASTGGASFAVPLVGQASVHPFNSNKFSDPRGGVGNRRYGLGPS